MIGRVRIVAASVAVALPLMEAGPALAGSPREEARRAAATYLAAIAHRDWPRVCSSLTRVARRDLLQTARDEGHPTKRCAGAARRVMFPELGRVPIVAVRIDRDGDAWITVGDAQHSDSGNDSFRMRLVGGRWKVLDL